MFKAVALFGRKKSTRAFKDYYKEWFDTLRKNLLPQLRRAMSASALSPAFLTTAVEAIHHHFQDYYEALDLAASNDVAQLLFPEWRNPLEKPFLWLGDLHPYLFTNLLRSFLDDEESDKEEEEENNAETGEDQGTELEIDFQKSSEFFNRPWHVVTAWKSPSKALTTRVDQIECGLRLMVPALMARAREAQMRFVERVGTEWVIYEEKKEKARAAVWEAMTAEMEELMGVFVDANRLRRSVLADILSVSSVHQAALFLEALIQFLAGLRDQHFVAEFAKADMVID